MRVARISSVVMLVCVAAGLSVCVRTAAEGPQKKLPPLVVDADSPLLLKGADAKTGSDKKGPAKKVSASVAENTACYVCHANYSEEPLVLWHAEGGVGCVDCHGKSFDHRNDENNTTPPDVMFPLAEINDSCEDCHETHDVAAVDVLARLQQRVPRVHSGEEVVCTQCHGTHRLDHRTVVWDRTTRKLLTGSNDSPRPDPGAQFDMLKKLAGTWVQMGAEGKPTEKVVSVFRVTAAGSAVVEVLFPGGEHEMMTVYHRDGDDLLLTHYCAAQNQPRMKCVAGVDPQLLEFKFVDATNMPSLEAHHMHAGSIRVVSQNRLQSEWHAYDKGKPVGTVKFDLVRQK